MLLDKTYKVSALKYRPQSFEEVVGQSAITTTLNFAIESDQLAQALLFCGPRGVGKTTCARILAKKINSKNNSKNTEDFSFNIFELDAASNNSVDDIRSLIEKVQIPPRVGTHKIYIIDEVHMLSQAAFNAFLKTLEEPPQHTIFILATTEKHKIIPTILSRCQIYEFKRITNNEIITYLEKIAIEKEVVYEKESFQLIANQADGALRDALSIFDRLVNFTENKLSVKLVSENLNVLNSDTYIELTELILENKIPELLIKYDDIDDRGIDGLYFLEGLSNHFRDILVCKSAITEHLVDFSTDVKNKYLKQSQKITKAFIVEYLELLNESIRDYRSFKNKRLRIELCLMQLCSVSFDIEKKKSS